MPDWPTLECSVALEAPAPTTNKIAAIAPTWAAKRTPPVIWLHDVTLTTPAPSCVAETYHLCFEWQEKQPPRYTGFCKQDYYKYISIALNYGVKP